MNEREKSTKLKYDFLKSNKTNRPIESLTKKEKAQEGLCAHIREETDDQYQE